MQKAIIASSLVALASGAPASSLSNALKKVRTEIRAQAKADAKGKGNLAVEALLKEEAVILGTSSDDDREKPEKSARGRFFEISSGPSDCSSSADFVEGMEMERCSDLIWNRDGGPYGVAVSEMMYRPKNKGFPIIALYDGHGCRMENAVGAMRLPKTDFGFTPPYKPADGCVPMYYHDMDRTPEFYTEARWVDRRIDPHFDAVMWGHDTKHKACLKEKFAYYEVERVGMCHEEHYDYMVDSPRTWYRYNVDDCNADGGNYDKTLYSSDDCSADSYVGVEHYADRAECEFQHNEFMVEIVETGGASYMDYRTQVCHKHMPPMPN